jgi:adenine-specific DNA-methyltransferase
MDEADYEEELTGAEDAEGNKMFKENTRTNPRFHSDWLSMMYERLNYCTRLTAKMTG